MNTIDLSSYSNNDLITLKNAVINELGDTSRYSKYARTLDKYSTFVSPYNPTGDLHCQVNLGFHMANRRLERIGFLTINDAYDCFGFDKTLAGVDPGWTWDINSTDKLRDYITCVYIDDYVILDFTPEYTNVWEHIEKEK